MDLRGFRTVVVCTLAAASCVLTLLSCDRSPTAPGGRLLVYVSQNGDGPSPGKTIQVVGTSLSQVTDKNGQARFMVGVGSYVVRAYAIGTPGPGRPYVEQNVVVEWAHTSKVEFFDCTMCGAPAMGSPAGMRN